MPLLPRRQERQQALDRVDAQAFLQVRWPHISSMTTLLRHFTAPSFWIGWLAALALAGLLVWAAGARWWSVAVAVAAVVAPLALLLLTHAVTRD